MIRRRGNIRCERRPMPAWRPPADRNARQVRRARVRRMFASIARRYDFLNHLLSLNIDRSWRAFTTRWSPPEPGIPILDCCTGTADLALAYDRAAGGKSPIVAADFCREMLRAGPREGRKGRGERADHADRE